MTESDTKANTKCHRQSAKGGERWIEHTLNETETGHGQRETQNLKLEQNRNRNRNLNKHTDIP